MNIQYEQNLDFEPTLLIIYINHLQQQFGRLESLQM